MRTAVAFEQSLITDGDPLELPTAPKNGTKNLVVVIGISAQVIVGGTDTITEGELTGQTSITVGEGAPQDLIYVDGVWYSTTPSVTSKFKNAGEILVGTGLGTGERLTPPSSPNQFLQSGGADPSDLEWVTFSAAGIIQTIYPVGSIYISTLATNPNTLLGFGTWVAYAGGRTLIGVGTSDQTYSAGSTGGASTTALTSVSQLPSISVTTNTSGETVNHEHFAASPSSNFIGDGNSPGAGVNAAGTANGRQMSATSAASNVHTHPVTITIAGTSTPFTTVSPYIVAYMWERTA